MGGVYDLSEMRMFRGKIAIIVAISIFLFVVLLISIVILITHNASKADSYNVAGDIIPSMKSVVGVRKISGVSSNYGNDIVSKAYTYDGVSSVSDDLIKYVNYLAKNEGFTTTKDYDLTKPTGKIQMGKQSQDVGKIILVNIDFYLRGYKITIEKGVGQIKLR